VEKIQRIRENHYILQMLMLLQLDQSPLIAQQNTPEARQQKHKIAQQETHAPRRNCAIEL
jgi:hypothetical protein